MRDRVLIPWSAAGVAVCMTLAGRVMLERVLLSKLRRDVRALNAGDYRPLLSGYAEDAVLRFNDGDHRWSGEHRGKAAIERFLHDFVGAGVQGELRELYLAGPPWRLRLVARFDDMATGADGEEIYRNRTVLVVRTRWGRIVHHEDYFEDTGRIAVLEARLRELGIAPAAAGAGGPA
jgi:ketosteroid isomerase-like protein